MPPSTDSTCGSCGLSVGHIMGRCCACGGPFSPSEPDIHDLFQRVRKHPDFVFGTIFTRGDFANRDCDGFPERQAEDAIVSRGSEFIADAGFAMSDEEGGL